MRKLITTNTVCSLIRILAHISTPRSGEEGDYGCSWFGGGCKVAPWLEVNQVCWRHSRWMGKSLFSRFYWLLFLLQPSMGHPFASQQTSQISPTAKLHSWEPTVLYLKFIWKLLKAFRVLKSLLKRAPSASAWAMLASSVCWWYLGGGWEGKGQRQSSCVWLENFHAQIWQQAGSLHFFWHEGVSDAQHSKAVLIRHTAT